MKKLYQKEWFGIDFKSFTALDSKKVADVVFYDRFYDEFYEKFNSFDNLPEDWKETKKQVAKLIIQMTDKDSKVLSIGSGNGYIEYLLWKEGRNITAIEPSVPATNFLRQNSNVKLYEGYFPSCLENANESSFDLAYMSGTEYIFNEKELLKLLEDIKDFNIKSFLLLSASIYNNSLLSLIKDMIKKILSFIGLYELGQFWGYKRTPVELIQSFKKAGFKDIRSGFLERNCFWLEGN